MNDDQTVTSLASLAGTPANDGTARWQPTRAGIVNLWRYWEETFTFHRGRLLLRGPNGSGKSMALELLLPFLLDADASPGRLTSAARSRGSLYDRLMAGSTESTRAGFAWVEFCRCAEVFTVGARIRASTSTRKVDITYFTTSLAVGDGLALLDERREPLSRRALADAIGAHGRVHTSGDEHRAAVREVLYPGFSTARYASVITALLALRKEKLSQNLDVDKLSAVLSDALPPLDEQDLAVVAEGFERLDRRRGELAALEAELAEVRALAARQRDYARAVVASEAHDVRSAETRRDDVTRNEREARSALETAQSEANAAETEAEELVSSLSSVEVEIEALRASDAYREGVALDDLRAEVRRSAELVQRDRVAATRAADDRDRAVDAHSAAAAEHEDAAGNAETAAAELRAVAATVAADAVVAESAAAPSEEGEALVRAWVRARRSLVGEVRTALRAHHDAVGRRTFAELALAADDAAVDERRGDRRAALENQAAAIDAFTADVRAWGAGSAIGVARMMAALPDPPTDPAEVTAAVATIAAELAAEHAVIRRDLDTARTGIEAEREPLLAERERLTDGRVEEPPTPIWRTDRAERAGGPLWRLVDVAPGVAAGDVDGLESALTAAGLLDAWVAPDGMVDLPADIADVLLGFDPRDAPASQPGRGRDGARTLGDVLVPLPDAPVAVPVIASLLASVRVAGSAVGLVDEPPPVALVGLDGTFRLGPAAGRGPTGPARLLGSEAQERRRLSRLAELDAAIADVDARLVENRRGVAALAAREAAIAADLAAVPGPDAVMAAEAHVATAETRLSDALDRLAKSRRDLVATEDAVRQALRALTTLAARHQLPTTDLELNEVAAALERLERTTAVWARRRRELAGAERQLRHTAEANERAAVGFAEASANLTASQRDAAALQVKLAALESAVGAEYHDVLNRLSDLEVERRRLQARSRDVAQARPALERRLGELGERLIQAEAARAEADRHRAATHQRFLAAIAHGLGLEAGLTLPDGGGEGVTAVLAAARAVAAELPDAIGDEQTVRRLSGRVEERLYHAQAAIGARVDLSRELMSEGWWVLRASSGGLRRAVTELASVITAELEAGRAELAADEERLFEQTLAGSVRHALADRIRLANALVDGINDQLAAVRTAAGAVQVRLGWEVDADQPEMVKAARGLLLRDPASLSEAERASLCDFVRMRVDQARLDVEANAPWEARLRATLDYRAWHRFTLQLAHRDWPGFRSATSRLLGRLSTGERSIVLHLPMLASIAAHYTDQSGAPSDCPRLILLDELFAGVDTANRAQLFGTFREWDLDAVLTSDHEWCQYATLDGIAIHHLHPAVGDGPVTSTRFTWDGRQRLVDPPAA